MLYTQKELQLHIQKEHNSSPFATYLQEIVYGGIDGIVTTFAVVAGFAGAQGGSHMVGIGFGAVLLFGLANLFADASSMALGNFISLRSEHDRYETERKKELHEIEHNTAMEIAESRLLLEKEGFNKEQSDVLVKIFQTNPRYWADFMMRYELEIVDLTSDNPFYTAFATFVAFLFFGAIPLLPYIFQMNPEIVFMSAIVATLIALLILGLVRWQITKQPLYRAVGEVIMLGSISACIAYFVGSFFKI